MRPTLVDMIRLATLLLVTLTVIATVATAGPQATLVEEVPWDTKHKTPPTLMGQSFHYTGSPNRYGIPAFYALHVWAWKHNPHGMFVDWNPKVSCEEYAGPPLLMNARRRLLTVPRGCRTNWAAEPDGTAREEGPWTLPIALDRSPPCIAARSSE